MLQITLKPTRQLVDLVTEGGSVQARVWEGESAGGVRVQALVARIAAEAAGDQTELEAELRQLPGPIPDMTAFPLRMVI